MSNQEQKNTMIEFLRLSFQEYVNETESVHSRPLWEPDEFISGDWGPGAEFIGGAYTSYFPPNVLSRIDNWQAYRQVEKGPNVFWAGADYHAGFGNGYIEGAIRSGQYKSRKKRCRRRIDVKPMTHGTAVVNCTSFLQLSSDCALFDFFMENSIEDIFFVGQNSLYYPTSSFCVPYF
jgi:hypothetical protein